MRQAHPRNRPWSRRLAPIVAASVSLGVSSLAAEFVYRSYRRVKYERAVEKWHNDLYCTLPPDRYYGCHPNLAYDAGIQQKAGVLHVTYHTDAGGWRVQPEVAATSATRRIMCLGDSYTFGVAVADDQTFPCHLQGALRARGLDVAVYNRGIPGYNSAQEYATLQAEFDAVAPHVVVLGYIMNDAEPVMHVPVSPDLTFAPCRSWLLEESGPRINAVARWLVSDQPAYRRRQIDVQLDYRKSFAPDSPKWRGSRDALAAIHVFLHARGVPLLVFLMPDFTQRFDDTYQFFLLHERVAEWGQAAGYPTFDLLPVFWGEDHRELWVEGDGHPSGEAQRRMALASADRVEHVLR